MKAAGGVFRLHDRAARSLEQIVDALPVIDSPPPPPRDGRFQPGTGPWQRKALSMKPGQSIVVSPEQASTFARACRGLGIATKRTTIAPGRVQVQIKA